MNEVICQACILPLRYNATHDELVCIVCGNVYTSEMMYDGHYDESIDEQLNTEVDRVLRFMDSESMSIDEVKREARDIYRHTSMNRKEAVEMAIFHKHTSTLDASTSFTNRTIECVTDVMKSISIPTNYRHDILNYVENIQLEDFCNPFSMACIAILAVVPAVDEKIFRLDSRFSKNIYKKYNERNV